MSKKLRNYTSADERKRAGDLIRGVTSSLFSIFQLRVSKRQSRAKENSRLKKLAVKNGIDPKTLKWVPSPLIHSVATLNQYLYICKRYAKWLAKNYPKVTKIDFAFQKGYAREYIQHLIDSGQKPSSIHQSASAIAKLYRCHSWEIHDSKPPRISSDFTRGRNYTVDDFRRDHEKHEALTDICIATGVREGSLRTLRPESFTEDSDGKLYLPLDGKINNTKGGKSFTIPVLGCMEGKVRDIIGNMKPGELLFPTIPSNFHPHNIRSLYGEELYHQFSRAIEDIPASERILLKCPKIDNSRPGQLRIDAPAIYKRRHDGRLFDRRALMLVALALGHGVDRVDVVVHSYLWRSEAPEIWAE